MARSLKNIRKDKDVSIGLSSSVVGNTLQLPTSASDPTGSSAGQIYFNTTSNIMRVYNGSAWNDAVTDTTGFATNGFSIAMAIAL